ncbi:Beta-1,3-galactosyl-O-glycosyl-glycoprotein beta-1,6-N-acetylglucosaminyltransferase 4 [Larimichthys crocea]|uniref:Beta-1,3-galactosyl-O-glycosyl-glycoprotein beta-1,6-N-acetylglucosaminyltransferase 4 n=1 Tax=Larimichthys crocea TaxID=215358 RepID=A0A6G0I277_LARCR|nr:Beta-1,3-galactosyl-O-glycosyl-glycoprotein beta-1,6-N-acetylglucosaminyltransferase 4 [Larimichthys crocea]
MSTRCSLFRPRSFMRSLLSLLALCLLLLSLIYSFIADLSPTPRVLNDIQTVHRHNINCEAIYDMDPVEVGKSLIIRRNKVVEDTDESLVNFTSDCPLFTKSRGYDDICVSEEEKHFPLAYSMVVHKSAWMVERLIKVLYSPGNIYCIHYDQKSSPEFISAMEGLARCLPNVFIASKRESVVYASISRLKADLNCMSDLLGSEVKWKYIINLCGQDFPLKSNIELVSELKKLNGAKTAQLKSPPPHGIEVFSGNAYFVLSRAFVEYTSRSIVVKDFLAWSEDTYSPDEHFWATLVRLEGVPGAVPRNQPDITDLMSKTRLVKWQYLEGNLYPPCTGTHVRSVCIYGAGELRWLLNYGHWFANKFDFNVDPVLIQCLEEKLAEKQKLFQSATSNTCKG